MPDEKAFRLIKREECVAMSNSNLVHSRTHQFYMLTHRTASTGVLQSLINA